MRKITGMQLMLFGALALLALLTACAPSVPSDYKWECEVERVRGTFLSKHPRERTRDMVYLYRFTKEGTRRDFMFPATQIKKCERK